MESVRRIRKERGLSQQALSELAGINKVTLVHIETGKSSPNVETLDKIARALDVEVADFFPKVEPSLFPPEIASPEQGRRTYEMTREIEHLREHVIDTLARWERVAHGEDPTLRIDYTYAIEVWMQISSLFNWFGKLLREATVREQRQIIGLIDELQKVGAEINAIADATEGMTHEAVEEEFQALADATVAAIVSEQNPGDRLTAQRRKNAEARYAKQAAQTAQQRAAEVKRVAAGE